MTAQPGDYVIVRRRPRVWQSVANIAGAFLILIGVAAALTFAYFAVVLVFALERTL